MLKDRSHRENLFCIVAILITLVIPPTLDIHIFGVQPATLIWLILFVIFIFGSKIKNDFRGVKLALVIALIITLSAVMSNTTQQFMLGGVVPFFGICIAIILFVPAINKKSNLNLCIKVILLFSVLEFFMASYQYTTKSWPLFDEINQAEFTSQAFFGRVSGTFGHPIVYGTFAGFCSLLALKYGGKFKYYLFFINLIGLFISGSRSGLFPLAAILIYIEYWNLIKIIKRQTILIRRVWITVMIITLIFLAIPFFIYNNGDLDLSRYLNLTQSISYQYRIQQWQAGLSLITENYTTILIGYGPGSTVELFSTRRLIDLWGPQTFDNAYVTLAFEYGIIGALLIFILIIASSINIKSDNNVFILYLVLNAIFFDAHRWPIYIVLFSIAVALCDVSLIKYNDIKSNVDRPETIGGKYII